MQGSFEDEPSYEKLSLVCVYIYGTSWDSAIIQLSRKLVAFSFTLQDDIDKCVRQVVYWRIIDVSLL